MSQPEYRVVRETKGNGKRLYIVEHRADPRMAWEAFPDAYGGPSTFPSERSARSFIFHIQGLATVKREVVWP